jgi:hypothetical protein
MPSDTRKRKRYSAFEDFPVDETHSGDVPRESKLSSLIEGVEQPRLERIERLKPSQMMPDRFQPRRLLPVSFREDFFSGQIDCYQAASQWISLTKRDQGHRDEIGRLIAMGESFEEHGQIKPITGSWVSAPDGGYVFLIETGERRFWAVCLLVAAGKLTKEPLLRIEVVGNPSRQRQVLENRHAESPSAVGQACEIAALILSEIGIQPEYDLYHDEYDYFRKARSQRMPAGLWDKIKPIMQFTRPRMVQLLNLLQLPSQLLDLADRYWLPERVLREILSLPGNQWDRMIRLSIKNGLTSDDVVELRNIDHETLARGKQPQRSKKPPSMIAASGLRRFTNVFKKLDEINQAQALDELADELVVSGEAESFLDLLDELSTLLLARLQRR